MNNIIGREERRVERKAGPNGFEWEPVSNNGEFGWLGTEVSRYVSFDSSHVIARVINCSFESERGEVWLRGDIRELYGGDDEDVNVDLGVGEDLENGRGERW